MFYMVSLWQNVLRSVILHVLDVLIQNYMGLLKFLKPNFMLCMDMSSRASFREIMETPLRNLQRYGM